MADEKCPKFTKIPSLVPYFHEEKVCRNKIPMGPKEIYDFDVYRCDSENHENCKLYLESQKSKTKLKLEEWK